MTTTLNFDPAVFVEAIGRRPFAISHRLGQHELLSVEALARLADALPPVSVEHNRGDVPVVLASGDAPRLDTTPGEIARTIDVNGCWMVLKNIERHPAYRQLLDDLLDEVDPLVVSREGPMTRREGFVFLSAPGSVTPAHIDPEHNFLLQVRGTKEMNVGRFDDPAVAQQEAERYFGGSHRNIDALPQQYDRFLLRPGDGIYVPVNAPHWVRNGDEVSVSLSITFHTATVEREQMVHAVNSRLRRLRLSPRAPGRSTWADHTKTVLMRSVHRVRRVGSGR